MKVVRIISLIARIALMTTLVLGLLFWLTQASFLSMLPGGVTQIIIAVHLILGPTGALFLLALSSVAIFTRGTRLLGVGGIIYPFIMTALGLTQTQLLIGNLHWLIQIAHLLIGIGAMYLALAIEKRYQRLRSGAPVGRSSEAQPISAPVQ
jgi:hypothetical protein